MTRQKIKLIVTSFKRLPTLLGVIVLLLAQPANANVNVRREMASVAADIANVLKAYGEESISVGQFTSPPQLAASAGPGIAHILSEELIKIGIEVKRRAEFGVEGKYRDVTDSKTGRIAAEISGTLTDKTGKIVLEFSQGLLGDAIVASLFGTTVEFPPRETMKQRDQRLVKSLDQPHTTFQKARIMTQPSSLFAIEILSAPKGHSQYKQVTPKDDEGLAFVPLMRNDVYQVRIINNAPFDAAVTLTIDGLNMFTFSEHSEYSYVIIKARTSGVIKGWHRTNRVSDEFLVTEFAKSAVAQRLSNSSSIGTITASFAAAWPVGSPPPADENRNAHPSSKSGNATGRGAEVASKYTEVRRELGAVRSVISVRYSR